MATLTYAITAWKPTASVTLRIDPASWIRTITMDASTPTDARTPGPAPAPAPAELEPRQKRIETPGEAGGDYLARVSFSP